MVLLEFDDSRFHRCRHLWPRTARTSRLRLQAGFTLVSVQPHPLGQGAFTDTHFPSDQGWREAFLQMQANGFEPDLKGVGMNVRTN